MLWASAWAPQSHGEARTPRHPNPRAWAAAWHPIGGGGVSHAASPQEQAFESSQKYKEGKFIIEMSHMVKENGWD